MNHGQPLKSFVNVHQPATLYPVAKRFSSDSTALISKRLCRCSAFSCATIALGRAVASAKSIEV